MESAKPKRGMRNVIVVLAIVALAAAGFFGFKKLSPRVLAKSRQAVFLTNGQVYFGYISKTGADFVELEDVYYLKTSAQLQNESSSKGKIMLIRPGSELHAPETTMKINREQILFYENMKSNSRVNQAIKNYNAGKVSQN